KAMALLVAFSGARMTELTAIQRKDIVDSGEEITANTIIKKEIREWLQDEECRYRFEDKIWWDYDKKKELGSIGCSREPRKILDYAEMDGCYASFIVIHAMMTKLRGEGASLEEVNDFTVHALGSGIVDVFYYKPNARNIGVLILKDSERNYINTDTFSQDTTNNTTSLSAAPGIEVAVQRANL
ncbi:MAG: hypothetical protein EZS28_022704, partial [Streblomastix strix]